MALVSYADIYEHTQVEDDQYKANLAKQIEDIVLVEPDAYEVLDMEHIVDCVNCIRDILSYDDGTFMQEREKHEFEYLLCSVNQNNYLESEFGELVAWHQVLKKIIEN
jgi:hypothetical protein